MTFTLPLSVAVGRCCPVVISGGFLCAIGCVNSTETLLLSLALLQWVYYHAFSKIGSRLLLLLLTAILLARLLFTEGWRCCGIVTPPRWWIDHLSLTHSCESSYTMPVLRNIVRIIARDLCTPCGSNELYLNYKLGQ